MKNLFIYYSSLHLLPQRLTLTSTPLQTQKQANIFVKGIAALVEPVNTHFL
jgi:hypothetical protein